MNGIIKKGRLVCVLFFCLEAPGVLFAQSESGLVFENVSGNVWMISGGGYANVSVLIGDGRALEVDSKRPEHGEEIRAWVKQMSGGDVQYLINGHEHPDHTDGNEGFGKAGATIIAHEDVRSVLAAGQRGGPPAPSDALPEILITDNGGLSIGFDGEMVHINHAPPAHTHSNLMVIYEHANVIHMGDLFSPERYPVIAGGTIDGFIAADELALSLADENTKFIPGNGPVTDKAGLQAYLNMVKTVKDRVAMMKVETLSLDDVIASNPTAEFDATWGDPGRFLPALYNGL